MSFIQLYLLLWAISATFVWLLFLAVCYLEWREVKKIDRKAYSIRFLGFAYTGALLSPAIRVGSLFLSIYWLMAGLALILNIQDFT